MKKEKSQRTVRYGITGQRINLKSSKRWAPPVRERAQTISYLGQIPNNTHQQMNLAEFSSELMKAKCGVSVRNQHLWEPLIQMIYTHTANWRASQGALVVKNPPANAGDIRGPDSFPESGRSPKEGHNNPLQYSCLENPMDRKAWWTLLRSQRVGHDSVTK